MTSARQIVGIEEGIDGSFLVHGLTLPGCTASGPNVEAAMDAWMASLNDWLSFLANEGEPTPSQDEEIEIHVEEWLQSDARIRQGESTVCFDSDREPLENEEVVRNLRILGALRGRLLPEVRRVRDGDLEAMGTPSWNARVVLDELARASWWTLTRLGSSPLGEVPERVIGRLDTSMALVVQRLTELDPGTREQCIELDGEEWTARKVIRRLLWLEWTLGAAALDALTLPQLRAT